HRLDDAKNKGAIIEILLYPKLRSLLRSEAKEIKPTSCNPWNGSPKTDADIKRIQVAVENALRDDVPVTVKTLTYLKNALMVEYSELTGPPCGADIEYKSDSPITYIADAVEPLTSSGQNAQSTKFRVAVSTVGQDGKPYNNLRVFARPQFGDEVEPFTTLS